MEQAFAWAHVGSDLCCHTASLGHNELIQWGPVTYICISILTILGSDNGLSPGWHWAIIWTNTGILLIGPLGTNFSEILIKIYTFSWKIAAILSQSQCVNHDDVIKWKHFPHHWPFVQEIHRSPVNSQQKGQWPELWCFLWSTPE